MSSKDKYTLSGNQYKHLKDICAGDIKPKFIFFPDFAINIAHIVSMNCIDKGTTALPDPNKFKEISEEQRQDNIKRLAEMKQKILGKGI